MRYFLALHLALLTLLFGLAGCSAPSTEASAKATDYLLVTFEQTGAGDSCEFKRTSTIAESVGLYLFEFKRQATGKGKFPSQMKFTGHDGLDYVRDETVSDALGGVPCNTLDVVWRQLKCKSVERAAMECPEVRFEGAEMFRSLKVER